MDRPEDQLVARLRPNPKGEKFEDKITRQRMVNVPKTERLSNPIDHRILPVNYRNRYERLKISDPAKAQEFWDKWSYDPRPKPINPFELEKKALAKLGKVKVNRPLRRRV
jgi:hypothetical protein